MSVGETTVGPCMCSGVAAAICEESAVPVVNIEEVTSVVCMKEVPVAFSKSDELNIARCVVAGAIPAPDVDLEVMVNVWYKAPGGRVYFLRNRIGAWIFSNANQMAKARAFDQLHGPECHVAWLSSTFYPLDRAGSLELQLKGCYSV